MRYIRNSFAKKVSENFNSWSEEIDASGPVDIGGATVTSGIITGGDWVNTLTWKRDGIHYQLCGSLERDELLRIARNIR